VLSLIVGAGAGTDAAGADVGIEGATAIGALDTFTFGVPGATGGGVGALDTFGAPGATKVVA